MIWHIWLHLSWVDPLKKTTIIFGKTPYQQPNLHYIRFGLGALEPDPSMKGSPVEEGGTGYTYQASPNQGTRPFMLLHKQRL